MAAEVEAGGTQFHSQRRSRRHLRVCGVRCNFGSDDFFFPSLIGIAIRLTWFLLTLAVCISIYEQPNCDDRDVPPLLAASAIGFTVLQLVVLFSDVSLVIISARGTLANSHPRRNINYFVLLRLCIYVIEVGWEVFSTYVIVGGDVADNLDCIPFRKAAYVYSTVVLLQWLLLAIIAILFLGYLDPCGCCCVVGLIKNLQFHDKKINRNIRLFNNKIDFAFWTSRLRAICCCYRRSGLNNSKKLALADVTRALGVVFSDFDAVFSDKVSGMLLAFHYHRRLEEIGRNPSAEIRQATVTLLKQRGTVPQNYKSLPVKPLDLETHRQLPDDLLHYYKFALATYGWPVQIFLSPCKAPFALCIGAKGCCCCPYCQSERFNGDDCFPNTVAISQIAGIPSSAIIEASFVNKVFECPFFVADIEDKKEVVIAIRGTFSLQDVLTDISVSMTEIEYTLLGLDDCFIHSGFLAAAENMQSKLEESQRFKDLVLEKGYRIVISGHSLGAGVSATLAVLLKHHHPEWSENLIAYGFSTPGAVFSHSLAKKCEEFVISVVGAYDMVPRMTMRSLGYLKMVVERLLDTVDIPKHKALCCGGFRCWKPQLPEQEELCGLNECDSSSKLPNPQTTVEEGSIFETASLKQLKTYLPWTIKRLRRSKYMVESTQVSVKRFVRRLRTIRRKEEDQGPLMFIPGHVLHLEETNEHSEKRCCGLRKERVMKASWKCREDFSAILVHKDMLLDHNPSRTLYLLQLLQKQMGTVTVSMATKSLVQEESTTL